MKPVSHAIGLVLAGTAFLSGTICAETQNDVGAIQRISVNPVRVLDETANHNGRATETPMNHDLLAANDAPDLGKPTGSQDMKADLQVSRDWKNLDGFPCGNFALAANVSRSGRIASTIIRNPGQLGHWLEPLAASAFCINTQSGPMTLDAMSDVQVTRRWPFSTIEGNHVDNPDLHFSATVFSPIGIDDDHTSNLPCILVDFLAENKGSKPADMTIRWRAKPAQSSDTPVPDADDAAMAIVGPLAISVDGKADVETDEEGLEATIHLAPGESRSLHWVLAAHDPYRAAARYFKDQTQVAEYALRNWQYLEDAAANLEKALPTTGIAELDEALRWYMGAAVYLTRCTKAGAEFTMGYNELNQRDSYWTSWAHLVLWPSLERRMIEESASSLQSDGKVPTCIFPNIERPDDLDINAYFALRYVRYVNFHEDTDFGNRLWPTALRAVQWLVTQSPGGLPVQGSFWGDWKDVAGVEGRKYSPHACLLYIATLDRMITLGRRLGKDAECDALQKELDKAREVVNRDTTDGGLWNGHYYVQIWKDGTVNDKILLDQCVGVLYGVLPQDQVDSVLDALQANRCPLGIRETWPFYPASFGYDPGTYHNGGVWPYLTFVGAWSYLQAGRRDEAVAIIKDMAHADLVAQGDWQPNEYVNAETGENCGPAIQGWDACLFGALYFGFAGKDVP